LAGDKKTHRRGSLLRWVGNLFLACYLFLHSPEATVVTIVVVEVVDIDDVKVIRSVTRDTITYAV